LIEGYTSLPFKLGIGIEGSCAVTVLGRREIIPFEGPPKRGSFSRAIEEAIVVG
jgi:hypothetical protein